MSKIKNGLELVYITHRDECWNAQGCAYNLDGYDDGAYVTTSRIVSINFDKKVLQTRDTTYNLILKWENK